MLKVLHSREAYDGAAVCDRARGGQAGDHASGRRREIVLRQIVVDVHQLLRAPQRLNQKQRVARVHLAQPLQSLLRPFRFSTERRQVSQYSSKNRRGAERRLPQQMVHVEMRPAARAQRRPHLVEIRRCRAAASGS